MKITPINNSIERKHRNNKTNNPSFNGITTGLINFWQFVDNGGRALQFTVEDMTGTNFPRSIKGLLAGKKYTGHFNWLAFGQEALREFLTGPTMCLVPLGVITVAKKLGGQSANIENANMRNLSYLLSEKTVRAEGESLEDAFYRTVVKDMLDKSTDKDVTGILYKDVLVDKSIVKDSEADITVVDKMVQLFKELGNNTDKKKGKELLAQIQSLFEDTVKSVKDSYENTNFLKAKYSTEVFNEAKNMQEVGATGVKNYATYAGAYIKDIVAKFGENVNKEQIRNFVSRKQIYRVITSIGGMTVLTGILMCQIPKIYTKVSGMVNPNASAIYDEAKKQKNAKKAEEHK